MTNIRPLLIIVTLAALLSGCGKKNDTIVPRRTAYPRIQLYDTIYKDLPTKPVTIMVNASTEPELSHRSDTDTWINVRYPRYQSTLSLTLLEISGEPLLDAIDNRSERMALNLNGVKYQPFRTSDSHISAIMPVAESPCVTPVQILATDYSSFLLTGALTFDGDTVRDIEEIAPVVSAVKDDIIYMINHLKQPR